MLYEAFEIWSHDDGRVYMVATYSTKPDGTIKVTQYFGDIAAELGFILATSQL